MVNAKTFLEKRYSEDMELEDAIHTALLTLKEGFEGERSSGGEGVECCWGCLLCWAEGREQSALWQQGRRAVYTVSGDPQWVRAAASTMVNRGVVEAAAAAGLALAPNLLDSLPPARLAPSRKPLRHAAPQASCRATTSRWRWWGRTASSGCSHLQRWPITFRKWSRDTAAHAAQH